MKKWNRIKTIITRGGQRGISLMEAAIAVMLLAGTVMTLIFSLSGGAMAVQSNDQDSVAQYLARAQMEYTKQYAYNPAAVTYPAINAPSDYTIAVGVSALPDTTNDIQKITVTVNRGGITVLTLVSYKENR